MHHRRLVLSTAMVLALAGCASGAVSPGAPTTSAPAASPPPAEASAAPSAPAASTPSPQAALPEPGGAGRCPAGEICDGIVGPGTYTSTSLGPTITFELADEWIAHADLPDVGFDLQTPESFDAGAPAVMSVVAFDGTVFDPACISSGSPVRIGASAAALLDHLAATPSLRVTDGPRPVAVGGIEGIQLDVEGLAPEGCDIPATALWIMAEPAGLFRLMEGETARIIGLDAGADTVAIVIESFPGADHEDLIERAGAVLGTMSIEPAS